MIRPITFENNPDVMPLVGIFWRVSWALDLLRLRQHNYLDDTAKTRKIILHLLYLMSALILEWEVILLRKDGKEVPVEDKIGTDLLHLAHENEIDLEGKNEQRFEKLCLSLFILVLVWRIVGLFDLPCNFGTKIFRYAAWGTNWKKTCLI